MHAADYADLGRYEIIYITVQDDVIANVAANIAASGGVGDKQLFVHCSGALPASILQPLTACGALIAACHPLQTFADIDSGIRHLPGTPWYCEGTMAAIAKIAPVIESLGGVMMPITAEQKSAYHAAVCMAANYMTALIAAADDIAVHAGLPRDKFRASLMPILRATLDNTITMGPRAALTGPVRRGDAATIARHIDVLREMDKKNGQGLADLYQSLADFTKRNLV
ncbi:MAG: DUF2520 domain-containing protein [Proteobacteria bacterium]|nr:DUF2520 domain-containing protein [Pseudomonadota bacterium]